jgi:glycerol-3-phosphate O-acyltransferase
MLGSGFRALSVGQVVQALRNILHFVRKRELPTTGEIDLDDAAGVGRALDALVANGVVTRVTEGFEPLYVIGPDQQLAAAYYRNTVVHFFVNPCIIEVALLRAAEADVADPLAAFWAETLRLRDLLKFEFFFADKEVFRGELIRELRFYDADWEQRVRGGGDSIRDLVASFRPFSSHRVLRPFAEAYQMVGDLLEREPAGADFDEAAFLERCLRLGRQYHLQRRIHSAASVSQVLFATALRLARNRGCLDPAAADVAERRRALAEEIRDVVRRTEAIDALAASRRAGLIP